MKLIRSGDSWLNLDMVVRFEYGTLDGRRGLQVTFADGTPVHLFDDDIQRFLEAINAESAPELFPRWTGLADDGLGEIE